MTTKRYDRFCVLRDSFRERVEAWSSALPELADAQRELARTSGTPAYAVETPVVYNAALDGVGRDADIAWIVVADNPGKKEQAAGANRYLIGPSGKAAENFFSRELGVDFRSRTVIVNKTPIHTPKTVQLRALAAGRPRITAVLEESQAFMAALVPELQAALGAPVWIMGISELGRRGIFAPWKAALLQAYSRASPGLLDGVYVFNHFSMGSFATELKRRRLPGETTPRAVLRIGAENRARSLGE